MLQVLTTIALVVHVAAGGVAMLAGAVAVFAPKGRRVHRTAGVVFVVSMMVMALLADYLGVAIPDQLPNVIVGTFAFYLVATAWLAVRRKPGERSLLDVAALLLIVVIGAPFALLSFQLATGMTPFLPSAIPYKGPVLIAVYSFTALFVFAALCDAWVVFAGGLGGAARIARHLWRMCLALALAYGSGFTNGFARLLPGPFHVPPAFFLPQFVPLLLLIFWMIRVRLTGWYRKSGAAA